MVEWSRINTLETGAYGAGLSIPAWACLEVTEENLAILDRLIATAPK